MKYIKPLLLLAIFCGFSCLCSYTKHATDLQLSDFFLIQSFWHIDYQPGQIAEFVFCYTPLLLFHILFGTYIYKHFCCASIYYFSRTPNRCRWFLKESVKLYIYCLLYLVLMILSAIIITCFITPIHYDKESIIIGIYYLCIHSFCLFATTLEINILSIMFGSYIGFVVVESIFLFGIALHASMGEFFITSPEKKDTIMWLFKINPFSHLVFNIHSSRIASVNERINIDAMTFDLDCSVIYFSVIIILLVTFGCVIIKNQDIIHTGGN